MISIRLNGEHRPMDPGQVVAALVEAVTGRVINDAGHAADGQRLGWRWHSMR